MRSSSSKRKSGSFRGRGQLQTRSNSGYSRGTPQSKSQTPAAPDTRDTRAPICSNCGLQHHRCPATGQSCFYCGKLNHWTGTLFVEVNLGTKANAENTFKSSQIAKEIKVVLPDNTTNVKNMHRFSQMKNILFSILLRYIMLTEKNMKPMVFSLWDPLF